VRKRKDGALVVIIGPDGAGKSSVSKMLVERLSSTSRPAIYVWCRFGSKLLGFLLRMNSKVAGFKEDFRESYRERSENKSTLLTNTPLKWPYLVFVVFSYMMSLHGKVARPLKEGNMIVSDRYVFDTIVDLWVDFGRKKKHLDFLIPLMTNIAPPPKLVFLLDVPEEVSMSRKDDVPNIEYVAVRRMGYQLIAEMIGAVKLDGTEPVETNVGRIFDAIAKAQ